MNDSPHNYSELIELAALDAHGLLDPIETELFDRSFHNAPASVQDEIVRLQLRLATDESLLPSDLPPSSLKGKVIHAVAKAADKEAKRLAPLALIGARVGATRGNHNSTGSVVMWRAAALILFGVTVVLAIITFDSQRTAMDFSEKVSSLQAHDSLRKDGAPGMVETLTNPLSRIVRLERVEGNTNGYIRVSIFSNLNDPTDPGDENMVEQVRGEAFGYDLEAGAVVIIQGTTRSGEVIELARLDASNSMVPQVFNIPKDQLQGLIIAGVDAKTGARWI
jgi:hypothetical protein